MGLSPEKADVVEARIGYAFANRELLDMALTHASVPKNKYNNERLEFLGDRVLGLVVAQLLYESYPKEKEGDLAKRLTGLVQQAALVSVANDLQLGTFVRLSAGEEKAGGVKKDAIIADALEALIGAIYLDRGFTHAKTFITTRWESLLHAHTAPPEDPKTRLQEWAQQRGLPLPEYKLLGRSGSDHKPVFEIEVHVQGQGAAVASAASKRAAEKDAAGKMLMKIEGTP